MSEPTADLPEFDLVDDAASARLAEAVTSIEVGIASEELNRREAVVRLSEVTESLAEDYPDVTDGTTRTAIVRALRPAFERAGMEPLTPWEW